MQPRIVTNLQYGSVDLAKGAHFVVIEVRTVEHRAQLEEFERPSVLADALLQEERGTGRGTDDPNCGQRNERRKADQRHARDRHVHAALDDEP